MTHCGRCNCKLSPTMERGDIPVFCLHCTTLRRRERAERALAKRSERAKARMVG